MYVGRWVIRNCGTEKPDSVRCVRCNAVTSTHTSSPSNYGDAKVQYWRCSLFFFYSHISSVLHSHHHTWWVFWLTCYRVFPVYNLLWWNLYVRWVKAKLGKSWQMDWGHCSLQVGLKNETAAQKSLHFLSNLNVFKEHQRPKQIPSTRSLINRCIRRWGAALSQQPPRCLWAVCSCCFHNKPLFFSPE